MKKGVSVSSTVGFLAAALFVSTSFAAGQPISISYVGGGFTTSIDVAQDGVPADMTFATGKGTFGASNIQISTDFTPASSNDCPNGFDVKYDLVYSATVLSAPDQSQLFGVSTSGWLCANMTTGAYFGEVYGIYVGGTGRFESAAGAFTSPFSGANLHPGLGFRSIKGSIEGTLEMP